MLKLTIITEPECWDSDVEQFIPEKSVIVEFEHSLLSISKWESKWNIAFMSSDLDFEKLKSYAECMLLHEDDLEYIDLMTNENFDSIIKYIEKSQTATTINYRGNAPKSSAGKIITSEQIYFQMFSNHIPLECERWHLSRLVALLEVFNVSTDDRKMSKRETAQYYASLNKARRAKKK